MMGVKISDAAAERFRQLMQEDGKLPRVEIVAGGCNGFDKKFSMDFRRDDDIVHDLPNGAVILIDPTSEVLLDNSLIDFKKDLGGSYFSIEIPEATSTCGCGSSFSL